MLPRLVLLFSVLVLVAEPCASADPFDDVFADYQKDGKIDPCAHSPEELQQAKADVPNDIDQYAPDFPAALDAAMEDRASGSCGGGGDNGTGGAAPGTTTPGAPTTAAPAPAPGATAPNAPGQAPGPPGTAQPAPGASDGAIANAAGNDDSDSDFPAPLVALLAAGALLALSLLVW